MIKGTGIEAPESDATGRDLGFGYVGSLGLHLGLIALIAIKTVVFPSNPIALVPTLRVDLVGLPDLLKSEKRALPMDDKMLEALKKAEASAQKMKPVPIPESEPDEMVLHPKSKRAREKKLKSALDRIKALNKIAESETTSAVVKGNRISKGTSLSSDARESLTASYYDAVRDALQSNWALPVWLARQQLSAQAQITIDFKGNLRTFRMIKSSGNSQFDAYVSQTVQSSAPYPRPPAEISAQVLSSGILVGFPL